MRAAACVALAGAYLAPTARAPPTSATAAGPPPLRPAPAALRPALSGRHRPGQQRRKRNHAHPRCFSLSHSFFRLHFAGVAQEK